MSKNKNKTKKQQRPNNISSIANKVTDRSYSDEELVNIIVAALSKYDNTKEDEIPKAFKTITYVLFYGFASFLMLFGIIGLAATFYLYFDTKTFSIPEFIVGAVACILSGTLGFLSFKDLKKIEKSKNPQYILSILSVLLAIGALIVSLFK